MRGIAECPERVLYKEFGINAELMIDHAFGRESCTMRDIKNYSPKSRSVSSSQILFEDYSREKAAIVLEEMTRATTLDLIKRRLIARRVSVGVGYSSSQSVPTGGSTKLPNATAVFDYILPFVMKIYQKTTVPGVPIRRLSIAFDELSDECAEGYDLFTEKWKN